MSMPSEREAGLQKLNTVRELWATWTYAILTSILRPLESKAKIAYVTFALVFVVFVWYSLRTSYSYSATASLLFSPPTFQTKSPGAEMMPEPLDMPSYSKLIRDGAILEKVAARLYKEKPELWETMHDSERMVPQVLQLMISVATEVIEKTPQKVTYARALYLTASANSPERAQHLANVWAEEAVDAARKFTLPSAAATIEFVRTEFDAAKTELESKDELLRQDQAQFDVERMKLLKEELVKILAKQKGDLAAAEVAVADGRKQVEEIQKLLAAEKPTLEIRRAPSVDALAQIGADGGKNVPLYKEEIENHAYPSLKAFEAESVQLLSGAEGRVEALQTEIAKMEADLATLNEQFVQHDTKQKQLMREITAGDEYLLAMAKQRDEIALLEASTKMEQAKSIFIANAPTLPTDPSNKLVRWAALPIGFALALIAAIAAANFAYEIDRVRAAQSKAEEPAE